MKIVVKNLSNSQINHLKTAFSSLDTTKNGYITANELKVAMRNHGFELASEEIDKIISNCSYIESGKINYSEFLVATLNKKALLNEESMWEAFKFFDVKNCGKINKNDMESALKKAGCEFTSEEFIELIAQAKLESNTDINFENFKIILSCFEEDNNIKEVRRASYSKRLSQDFKEQFKRANTICNKKTIES